MFYRSNILKEFQEHISKLNAIDLYNLLQDIMNKLEEESTLYNNWYTHKCINYFYMLLMFYTNKYVKAIEN